MTKILVIDDDRMVVRLVSRWYEGTDFEVIAATTAEDGLEQVRRYRPDVLLLDIMLPELSGLDAYEAIRAIDSKLPVIYITGHGSSEMAIEAMKLGAYDYLQKPLSKDKVLELVGRAAVGEVLDFGRVGDARCCADGTRTAAADAINHRERDLSVLLIGNVDATDTGHSCYPFSLSGAVTVRNGKPAILTRKSLILNTNLA